MSKVLVTGGSGFVGAHAILQLIVAGTPRQHLRPPPEPRTPASRDANSPAGLNLFATDLNSDAGWREAAAGCDAVLHIASPIPPAAPKHEDELIAREGTLRVLRDANVKGRRPHGAIYYGHPLRKEPFDESQLDHCQ